MLDKFSKFLEGLPIKPYAKFIFSGLQSCLHYFITRNVPISKILMGGEGGVPADKYAVVVGNFMRPSTRITNGPHYELLRLYDNIGDQLFLPAFFCKTGYYKNALSCIEHLGSYFGVSNAAEIVFLARRFVDYYRGITNERQLPGQSPPGAPILLAPVYRSTYFQIIDGNHRLAMLAARGVATARARVLPKVVMTPLQKLLQECLWIGGEHEIYQPLDAPEVQDGWILVRNCEDRFEKMRKFLSENVSLPKGSSYLDLGANYGWFVWRFSQLGFDSVGVEMDPFAIRVGEYVYRLKKEMMLQLDCTYFLKNNRRKFDVVSSLSFAHHLISGKIEGDIDEFIKLLDSVTRKVLFFEMGHTGEKWYRKTLGQWSIDFTENWLKKVTSFAKIVRLGSDCDSKGPFKGNYGRMLFACVR